uniref:CCHC-type domain-containing protein n=1 Tax=Oryza barthii TaxID=65489 RepID=A0A0D3G0H8_9ORYZ
MDFRAAVLSGLSGGRSLRDSSVSSEESVDSGSSQRAPRAAEDRLPAAGARAGAWADSVRLAAVAAAAAQPPAQSLGAVAGGEGQRLRSVVVRPPAVAAEPSCPASRPASQPAEQGRGKGILSVVVAPPSAKFRNLERGQSSRNPVPPPQPPSAPARPDTDPLGWQVVRRKKSKNKSASPPRRPVPKDLNGVCFNCLERGHVRAECRAPPSCFGCGQPGHRLEDCSQRRLRPRPRGGRSPPAGPSRQHDEDRPRPQPHRRSPASHSPPAQRCRVVLPRGSPPTPPGARGPTPPRSPSTDPPAPYSSSGASSPGSPGSPSPPCSPRDGCASLSPARTNRLTEYDCIPPGDPELRVSREICILPFSDAMRSREALLQKVVVAVVVAVVPPSVSDVHEELSAGLSLAPDSFSGPPRRHFFNTARGRRDGSPPPQPPGQQPSGSRRAVPSGQDGGSGEVIAVALCGHVRRVPTALWLLPGQVRLVIQSGAGWPNSARRRGTQPWRVAGGRLPVRGAIGGTIRQSAKVEKYCFLQSAAFAGGSPEEDKFPLGKLWSSLRKLWSLRQDHAWAR